MSRFDIFYTGKLFSHSYIFFGRACTKRFTTGCKLQSEKKRKEYISGCWWIKMYKIFSFGWMLTAYHKYSLLNGRTKAKSVHLANPRSQCKGHSTLPLFFSSELGFVFDFFLQSYFKMGLPLSMYRDCRSEYSMALMFWEDYTFLSLLFLCALLLYSLQNDDFFSGTITRVTLWEHRRI